MFALIVSFIMSFFAPASKPTPNTAKPTVSVRSSSMMDTGGETAHAPNH
ncbi:hypothetical protein [Pinibacter aurantiacus]|nr:hypothetical protein [Pinibacter aurantiacus]